MSGPEPIFVVAALSGAVGIWLLLARSRPWQRVAGGLVTAIGLGLLGSQLPRLGDWVADSVFLILAVVTVTAAVATVTLRNPVYCAIWFGLMLLGTAGLFFFEGAQFLAVATVVVYAGAILVTFLFVLMLAAPRGRTVYDQSNFEALVSAFSGAVLVGILSMTLSSVLAGTNQLQPAGLTADSGGPAASSDRAVSDDRVVSDDRKAGVLTPHHVRAIGAELFGRYLIAVEVSGVLLLAALVGAAAIVAGRLSHQQERPLENENQSDGKP